MDINALKRKFDKLQSGGGNDDIYKLQFGEQVLRIVPYKFDKSMPFTELQFHYGVNGKDTYLSPQSFGRPDPIAEFGEAIRRESKDGWKKAKKFLPSIRTFVPVVVRGEEDKGVRFWSFGKTVYSELMTYILDPDYGDISDPMTGTDLKVVYAKPEETGNMYPTTTVRPARKPTKLSNDPKLVKKWLDEQKDVTTLYPELSYDELSDILEAWLSGKSNTEDDDVEKEVEKTTKRENEKLVDDMFEDDESTSGDSEDGGDDEDVDYTSEFDDMFDD